MNKPEIVILGAGYGGMMATVKLQKLLRPNDAQITVVNKHDYHYQTTRLHEAAAGTIHDDLTRIPIREVVDLNKINLIQDTVVEIKWQEKEVRLENGVVKYDILVIGLGFEAETKEIPGLDKHAFTMQSFNSARFLRNHLQYNFAKYHYEKEQNDARLNIVVGGGGFTGIELMGELANRIPQLCEEYDINKAKVRMIILESSSSILPDLDPQLIEYASNSLESRGVEIITNASLKECKPESVVYEKDGKQLTIQTMTTVWCGGVRANSIVEKSGLSTSNGKVEVEPSLQAPQADDVFVIGDCALIMNRDGSAYPSTAQFAIQQANVISDNITRLVRGQKKLREFKPKTRGTVVSLGHNDAVGMIINDRKLYGWKATVTKKMIENQYLVKLGGFGLLMRKGKFNLFY